MPNRARYKQGLLANDLVLRACLRIQTVHEQNAFSGVSDGLSPSLALASLARPSPRRLAVLSYRIGYYLWLKPGLGQNHINKKAGHEAVHGCWLQIRFRVFGNRQKGQNANHEPDRPSPVPCKIDSLSWPCPPFPRYP